MPVTPQQKLFIEEYVKSRVGTKAAIAAGYSPNGAGVIASDMLSRPEIKEELSRILKEKGMEVDEVLARLAEIARFDLGRWVSDQGEIDIGQMKRDGYGHLIRKVDRTVRTGVSKDGSRWTSETVKIETYSVLEALKAMGTLLTAGAAGTEGDPYHVKFIMGVSADDR